MTEFIDDLKVIADEALQVRDELGAIKDEVYIVTRSWSGERIGDGGASESKVRVLPSPWIVDLSHDIRVMEAGAVKQGDIFLKQLSQEKYPNESDIDCSSDDKLVEKFYEIGQYIYKVVNVKKRYATWEVQVRRLSSQTRY